MLVALLRMSLVLLQSLCLGERLHRSMRTMLFFCRGDVEESNITELVQEFHGKSGRISRITSIVSIG